MKARVSALLSLAAGRLNNASPLPGTGLNNTYFSERVNIAVGLL